MLIRNNLLASGEKLSDYYEIAPSAGHDFAHYVATSFRKVREKLNLTLGVRPWEEEAPGGMPLFRCVFTPFILLLCNTHRCFSLLLCII